MPSLLPGEAWQQRIWKQKRGFPIALRSPFEPWGLADLFGTDLGTLQKSNAVMHVCLTLLKACVIAGLPAWVENPASSPLWRFPEMVKLKSHDMFDQCQFCAPYMKRTTIWFFMCKHFCPEELGFQKCKYKRQMRGRPSFCQYLGREHAWLTGFVEGEL